ncbi:translin-associated protein X-like [Oculina patagonica]
MAAVGKRRGEKRSRTQTNESNFPKRQIDENSPIIKSFRKHQQELDSRHDKHERLVKCSRDVTIASKRIIFLLQRVAGTDKREQILKEADEKFLEVKELLKTIASELEGEDPYRFSRAYSPGLQEYIEALSFSHFLKNKTLISYEQVKATFEFSKEGGKDLDLNPFDYVLGIADLTGELMRLCINSAANGDQNTPFEVCRFLREIHEAFLSFGNVSRDVASKLRVLKTSMNKVENACYTLRVRGSEIPQFSLAEALNTDVVTEDCNY